MNKKSSVLAAPYALWMLLFTVVPLGMVVYFAFWGENGFTLEYIKSIAETQYARPLGVSVWLGLIATVICLLLGFPIAYIISRAKGISQRTMVMLIMLPQWMNFLLRTYALMSLLENNGLINTWLRDVGLEPINIINTRAAVVLGMVYDFLPFMVLPIYSVLTKIDNRVTEAAQDLGANGFVVFRRIILPLSVPGIISGITMVFVPSVSSFIISQLLGGGKEMLIGDVIEMMFVHVEGGRNIGAALSLVLMALMLICMTLMNHFDDSEDVGGLMV
ncbi:MAG: ABC transporter permease [Clostridia bacterium]|nr:ABC transporter permease [Oscillospiraceae bacterium]MBQ6797477.1 ABC transporter permease [Clostridia bacterium]